MSERQPTPGPWWISGDGTKVLANIPGYTTNWAVAECRVPEPVLGGIETFPSKANAKLIVSLANIYFAGRKIAEEREAKIEAEGNLPPARHYGLTETEIIACEMLNALAAERDALLEACNRMRTAIETGEVQCDVLNGRFWEAKRLMYAAIDKANGNDGA